MQGSAPAPHLAVTAPPTPAPPRLPQLGPEGLTGASNYYVDVYSADGKEVAARVWILDSGNMVCEGLSGWWWAWGDGQWQKLHSELIRDGCASTVALR